MTTTEPEPTTPETDEPTALQGVGPVAEAGDPGTPEHQAILAVLRENAVQSSTDADNLATMLVTAFRNNPPAAEAEADEDADTEQTEPEEAE